MILAHILYDGPDCDAPAQVRPFSSEEEAQDFLHLDWCDLHGIDPLSATFAQSAEIAGAMVEFRPAGG